MYLYCTTITAARPKENLIYSIIKSVFSPSERQIHTRRQAFFDYFASSGFDSPCVVPAALKQEKINAKILSYESIKYNWSTYEKIMLCVIDTCYIVSSSLYTQSTGLCTIPQHSGRCSLCFDRFKNRSCYGRAKCRYTNKAGKPD